MFLFPIAPSFSFSVFFHTPIPMDGSALNAEYLITIQKNNGLEGKLILHQKQLVFITRSNQHFEIPEISVKFPIKLFESNTIFDVVLVHNQNQNQNQPILALQYRK